MPEHYTYLLVDLCCIIVPFLFSFHPTINFYKQWRFFWLPCLVTAFIFLVWDVLFTREGVWSFNRGYVCGLYFCSLPLEEYLFFICIPYAAVFTWFCIGSFFQFQQIPVRIPDIFFMPHIAAHLYGTFSPAAIVYFSYLHSARISSWFCPEQ